MKEKGKSQSEAKTHDELVVMAGPTEAPGEKGKSQGERLKVKAGELHGKK